MLQRFINGQLPEFARPDTPVMRYTLLREGRRTRPMTRALRVVISLILLIVLVIFGYEVATGFGTTPFEETLSPLDQVFSVLYWPLILLQIGLQLAAIGATTGIIAAETRSGTWDSLKITTDGVGLALRARWASVFYQLRYLLLLIMTARIFFVIVALIDFTSFQGRRLDLLFTGTTPLGSPDANPVISLALAVIIAALSMTACLIIPFTTVAFHASLGMVLGTLFKGRWMGTLSQAVILLIRLGVTLLALWIGAAALLAIPLPFDTSLISPTTAPSGGPLTWIGAFFGLAEGDLGLTLLHVPDVQGVWTNIDYGVLIGVGVLIYALLQAGVAQLLIRFAVARAASADRT